MAQELTERPLSPQEKYEADTIACITAAIRAGFDPNDEREITMKQVIDACAIVVTFLKEAERKPGRSIQEWRHAVENLHVTLGKKGERQ